MRLTAVQQGMLYHHLRSPHSGVDIEQMIAGVQAELNPLFFRKAWECLVDNHSAFRTRFVWEGQSEPTQCVEPGGDIDWREQDLSRLRPDEADALISNYLAEDRKRGFDLSRAPLTRGALFRLGPNDWKFAWTFHHISADGQSYPSLIKEAFSIYGALLAGENFRPSTSPSLASFIDWQKTHLDRQRDQAQAFWQRQLDGISAPTPFPGSPARSAEPELKELSLSLPSDATARLVRFAKDNGLTINSLVQAAWALHLGARTGEEAVVFGETRACRRNTVEQSDDIIGTLINTVPVCARIAPNLGVVDWLKAFRANQIAIREFEHTPLSEVHGWSQIPAKLPMFDTLVVFTNRLIGAALRDLGGAWASRHIHFLEQTNYPITLFAYNEPELVLKLAYDRARLPDEQGKFCLEHLLCLLQAFAQPGRRKIADLPLVGDREFERVIREYNATELPYDQTTIDSAFEACVRAYPHAVAVAYRDSALTYAELDERARRLANRLRAKGAAPGKIVGIHLHRSLDLPVAILAVLKSGAAYLPMDPAFPKERLAWMIEDTQIRLVVTQSELAAAAVAGTEHVEPLLIDTSDASMPPITHPDNQRASARDLAYVIFTSGSSGRPKGVMIEHRNVANFFAGMDERLGRAPGTWLAVTSISFDISVLEILWTLTRGFKVVIQDDARQTPARSSTDRSATESIDFSLFYFAAEAKGDKADKYRLLLEGARIADERGFSAVWTPERHFHAFGGLYPNPALTSTAIAAITRRIQIRAGSVVLPLHNPVRVAEEWSVVDNLSGGRVGLSFASGWHIDDFALMPQNYAKRKELTIEGIDIVRRLWRGEKIKMPNGSGSEVEVGIFPPSLQKNPPIWLTSSGSIETFREAGARGFNLLTNLLGQKIEELEVKIAAYRKARREHGHEGEGIVSLMLHTFVGETDAEVRRKVQRPFIEYLKTSTDLIKRARWEFPAFANAGSGRLQSHTDDDLSPDELDALLDHAFDRYFETSGLFGSVERCIRIVNRLRANGVNEIACLIDFGVAEEDVLQSLKLLDIVRQESNRPSTTEGYAIADQIVRHGVTHLQCTPSLARVLVMDSAAELRPIRKMMVGGEALPPTLAQEITRVIDGDLLNMYGPTETTVWSTTSEIDGPQADITIGRPIANTQVYIVDREMRPVPIGTAGELLIGGDGVARGYFNRPELTAQKFVADRFSSVPGARLYRTGDLARYRDDGSIEFLGRIDHQVKIRGHRIELGEIEATLACHPAVSECAAVVHQSASDRPNLVAYVTTTGSSAAPSHWDEVWDETYKTALTRPEKASDTTLNTAGWISSYTGEPIPESEMREWVDRTVERITALKPRRVLEIGCGFGMLLSRIAPTCESYVGIDFSEAAVRYVQTLVTERGLPNVTVRRAAAHEFESAQDSFDLIILNSIVQYFPSAEYLVDILARFAPLVARGGEIFVGDVRSLPHLDAFYCSVELELAPDDLDTEELRRKIRRRRQNESELVFDPSFFRAIRAEIPRISSTEIHLKRGRFKNEMTCFRYDVVLGIGESRSGAPPNNIVAAEKMNASEICNAVRLAKPGTRLANIRNSRLAASVRALQLLSSPDCPTSAGELRRAANKIIPGFDPEDLFQAIDSEPMLIWSETKLDEFDVVLSDARSVELPPHQSSAFPRKDWSEFINAKSDPLGAAKLRQELIELARRRLPEIMVPNAIIVMDSMPRTPNGKLDRKALPAPDERVVSVEAEFTAPESELEKTIAQVWRDLLGIARVGMLENFFDLGANSLLMMQANMRLRQKLGRELSLVELFRFPTVRTLAEHLSGHQDAQKTLNQSAQRGHARRDALRRRQDVELYNRGK